MIGVARILCLGLMLAMGLWAAETSPSKPTLTAREIVAKIQDRVRSLDENTNDFCYEYHKTTRLEKLDRSHHESVETNITISLVLLTNGTATSRTLSMNGVAPPPPKNDRVDTADPSEISDRTASPWLNEGLINRFAFDLSGEETEHGRKCWVIRFSPKPGWRPGGDLPERLMSRLAGVLLVDQDEFEVSRMDVRLLQKVKFYGGVIGSLEELTLSIARQRLDDGHWIEASSTATIIGRKLLNSIRFRSTETVSDVKRVHPDELRITKSLKP